MIYWDAPVETLKENLGSFESDIQQRAILIIHLQLHFLFSLVPMGEEEIPPIGFPPGRGQILTI